MPLVVCPICQRGFEAEPWTLRRASRRYCSLPCRNIGYQTTPDTFWSRVASCSHEPWCLYCCFPWQGAICTNGYGQVRMWKAPWLTHRLAWVLYHGQRIPSGKVCRHLCHNRLCCNVMHLMIGSPKENSGDSMRAGRMPSGSRNRGGGNKLTEADIPQILTWYAAGLSAQKIATAFGVSDTMIFHILHGKLWRQQTHDLLPVRSYANTTLSLVDILPTTQES